MKRLISIVALLGALTATAAALAARSRSATGGTSTPTASALNEIAVSEASRWSTSTTLRWVAAAQRAPPESRARAQASSRPASCA